MFRKRGIVVLWIVCEPKKLPRWMIWEENRDRGIGVNQSFETKERKFLRVNRGLFTCAFMQLKPWSGCYAVSICCAIPPFECTLQQGLYCPFLLPCVLTELLCSNDEWWFYRPPYQKRESSIKVVQTIVDKPIPTKRHFGRLLLKLKIFSCVNDILFSYEIRWHSGQPTSQRELKQA